VTRIPKTCVSQIPLRAQRAIVLSQLVATVIGAIVAVMGALSGVMSALGWLAVGIYLVLALGYGYFQFAKPRTS